MIPYALIGIVVSVIVVVVLLISLLSRYKRCPSDKILVIYGKVAKGQTAHCIHGGAAFIWPIIQDCKMLDLSPLQIEIPLDNALSKQNIRVSVPAVFTVGISTKPEVMAAAAERLLGSDAKQIAKLAEEIIVGQMRLVVAQMDIEEINADRDKFLKGIYTNVENEIEKIGLRLLNVNIKDIQDTSGYLTALGQNAAAEAVNKAKKAVAEKDRDGESGKADADKTKRINVAGANALAVTGENTAAVDIANSISDMRQKKANAEKSAVAAENVKAAEALKESYRAQKEAEDARAEKERSTKVANEIVAADIEKQKVIIKADAEKEKQIKEAEGKAQATYLNMEAQARGLLEILSKQAEGLKRIVEAAGGNPDKAAMLLIIDKLPELVKTQVEAIKNIKFDKITVWDSGSNGLDGKGSTAKFLSGLMSSLPPLQNILNMAGMDLPEWMAKDESKPEPEVKQSQLLKKS